MQRIRFAVLLALILVMATVGFAAAQDPAYNTQFITSITFQNVGTEAANVVFNFYPEASDQEPIVVQRPLAAGAGSSLFVGGLQGDEALPTNFLGSAVMSANQPVVATLVQLPQSTTVKNRPLSNGFSNVTSKVLLATVLKNRFGTTSRFSIQNADSGPAVIKVKIFNADNTAAPAITLPDVLLPAGSAKYFDMGELGQVTDGVFNGSATVEAVKQGGSTPANIVGSVVELGTSGVGAAAFEGVSGGSTTVNMATALCDAFGGQRTAYAVQNVGTNPANVTVAYKPGTATAQATIQPGAKNSFIACDAGVGAGFSGAAVITSNEPIVVIGKLFGAGLGTAFLGEASGSQKLALPYVRYRNDASYNAGDGQRAFIAIQNVGGAAVGPVTVKYLDKLGTVVGTHTIPSIDPGAKANSRSILATGDAAKLLDFGNPNVNPGGGFGGAAIIEGPGGAQLIAIARIQSTAVAPAPPGQVAEDYNGIPVN